MYIICTLHYTIILYTEFSDINSFLISLFL